MNELKITINNIDVIISINKWNYLFVEFSKRPSKEVLTALKENGFNWFSQVKKWSTKKFNDDVVNCSKYITNVFSIYESVTSALDTTKALKEPVKASKSLKNDSVVLSDEELKHVVSKYKNEILASYNRLETPLLFLRKNGYIVIDSLEYHKLPKKDINTISKNYMLSSIDMIV